MHKIKQILAAAALATGFVLPGVPAEATLVWQLDPSQCSDAANTNNVCDAGFAATATFVFSNIDADSVDVQITVENNSTVSPAPLSAFGFSVPPGLINDADGTHDGAVANGALPTGWFVNLGAFTLGFLDVGDPNADAEVCLSIADGKCFGTSGNPAIVANALDGGESAVFDLTLDNLDAGGGQAFATLAEYEGAFVDGNPVFFRFKPLEGNLGNPGSVKFGGQQQVPEPGALSLFGMGLIGLGALARRRRGKA